MCMRTRMYGRVRVSVSVRACVRACVGLYTKGQHGALAQPFPALFLRQDLMDSGAHCFSSQVGQGAQDAPALPPHYSPGITGLN